MFAFWSCLLHSFYEQFRPGLARLGETHPIDNANFCNHLVPVEVESNSGFFLVQLFPFTKSSWKYKVLEEPTENDQ